MYVLGIDFGGGACKATLLSEAGKTTATHTVEYSTAYPKPGWCEQNPSDWFDAARSVIAAVLEKSRTRSDEIVALSLDAATHTAVLCDGNFSVLRPAIYWTDSRSTEESRYLNSNYAKLIESRVLHRPDTIWTLPQLLWIKTYEPEIWARTEKILFAKDYVRNRLTGDYMTDYIEAQGSMFFDYNRLEWSEELCDLLDLEPSKLPEIVAPTDIVGEITSKASQETGLKAGTPVLCGSTDTVMEVFASGAIRPGQMTVKLATAGRICVITEQKHPSPFLINYSHVVPGLWYPGTATKSCAASYRWYRDTFGGEYGELDQTAADVPVGCDGLMFHPYLNGELTPYGDPLLSGSFIGIRSHHTKAHFNRAVLEGVAFSLRDCLEALKSLHIPHETEATVIGGGAASPLWRRILSDMLGIRLVEKERSDSSFGSAMSAGIAAGMFENFEDALNRCGKNRSITEPIEENTVQYCSKFDRYKAVHDALAPVYHDR